ncbi:hypothetical protein P2318_26115 [Myxococcaceae bacterium GXIMD 01537]
MKDENRISSLSITPTIARQTPKNDFGDVLSRAADGVAKLGAGIVGGMVPGAPALSAAVSSTKATVSAVASGVTAVPGAGGAASAAGASGKGEQWDLLEAQKMMQAEGQAFNAAYLQLQNEMQRESREHNAVSNIMKVRHDSAKAAINNIR